MPTFVNFLDLCPYSFVIIFKISKCLTTTDKPLIHGRPGEYGAKGHPRGAKILYTFLDCLNIIFSGM